MLLNLVWFILTKVFLQLGEIDIQVMKNVSFVFIQNFCIKDLDLIENYFFKEIFELNDWDYQGKI